LFNYSGNVLISERTGILFEFHKTLDSFNEQNGSGVGSTKQGIGPFYEDNARRTTRITFRDYVADVFPERLRAVLSLKRPVLEQVGAWKEDLVDELLATHADARKRLKPFSARLENRLNEYLEGGHHIILEGGQGSGLDVDMGTIPETTSSHLLAGHAFPSLGLPRRAFQIWGVEKLYPTRVGSGDFPTLATDYFSGVAEDGGEYGATTRRRRRVGYPDWLLVRHFARMNDCDGIVLTRADVVQNRDLRVSKSYVVPDEGVISEMPLSLRGVQPIYTDDLYSWHLWRGPPNLSDPIAVDEALQPIRRAYVEGGINGLPEGLQKYVHEHDSFVGVRTVGVSIGPSRGETVYI
jgi:adenylosuccinate synthase